jgi:nicotinate-nucleotide adenylyltransferase
VTACIALLGGSFDPVHNGHVALGAYFVQLLQADRLRVIPTLPWQKSALVAAPEQRAEMARLAFSGQPYAVLVDRQEIERHKPTYTVETLRALRAELGPTASLCFLMGADQLARFNTWHEWQALFGLANFCVAARPGFSLDGPRVPPAVAAEFRQRLAAPAVVRNTPAGLACLAPDLAVDISSTVLREALAQGREPNSLVPQVVLDYIEQHNLYKN